MYEQWEHEFFDLPSVEKEPFLYNPTTQSGWAPPNVAEVAKGYSVRDLKEYFNYMASGVCPVALKPITAQLYTQLVAIAHQLLTWIQALTPAAVRENFSQPLPDMITDSPEILFRLNYYPALTGKEEPGALRAAAHADINLITVLMAGTEPGLQAQDRHGNWYDVPCEFGNIVINVGDMLQEASGGYYPSTLHQVLNPTGEDARKPRMSCPLFVHPRPEVILSERHTQASYLHERLVELGFRKP